MSKSYGYGLMNQKLNTLQTLILSSTPIPGSVGTLAQVLTNGAIANKSINMNDYAIDNISAISISTPPIITSELNFTRTSIPIVVDGVTYYIGLFTAPP